MEVTCTVVEAHSSLGLFKRHHQPLHSTFLSIMKSRPDIEKAFALSISFKAMNDTLGPEGHVPSAILFGEFHKSETRQRSGKKDHLYRRGQRLLKLQERRWQNAWPRSERNALFIKLSHPHATGATNQVNKYSCGGES